MTWIATAVAALGAAYQGYSQYETGKKQDRQLARQINRQSRNQERADAEVAQLLGERATSSAEPERREAASGYLERARAAQAAASRGLGQSGAVSDSYRAASNDAALGISDYGTRAANLMARIDAPVQQRQREALQSGDLSTRLGLIGRQAGSDDFLGQLQLQSIRPNPWLNAAAQAAQGAARGMAGNTRAAASAGTTAGFGSEAADWYKNPNLWGRG